MISQTAIGLFCCVLTAVPAAAQIDRFSPFRTVEVTGNNTFGFLFRDTDTTNLFQPGPDDAHPYFGDFDHSAEGFGLFDTNILAAFADQRSFTAENLADLPGPAPTLFQGSAAINASFNGPGDVSATARSTMDWAFTIDTATTIQLTWALAATSGGPAVQNNDRPAPGTSLMLAGQGFSFAQSADFGQLKEGGERFTLDPGTYLLNIDARLDFSADASSFTTPAEINQSAAYTVTLAVVPAPATLLPIAAVGGFATRRRRITPCV